MQGLNSVACVLMAAVVHLGMAPAPRAQGAAAAGGQRPAFPGAQGFGSTTPGGRGGRVIEVTNLNPTGPGSLREACAASGPRIIVFRVGGTIDLTTSGPVGIRHPFATLAGQTAPGDGILLKGAGLYVHTHDVIIRCLRIRIGDDPKGPSPQNRDGLFVGHSTAPPHNVIIDHCSVSWAIDENVSTWHPVHDITFQWCIISEALYRSLHPYGPHSMGLLVGPHADKISIHHCLLAHNHYRNPQIQSESRSEVVNNVVYNWGGVGTDYNAKKGRGPAYANIIGNTYKSGPNRNTKCIEIKRVMNPKSRFYLAGNVVPGRLTASGDQWTVVSGQTTCRWSTPAVEPSGITVHPAKDAYEWVLRHAGAVAPSRDAVDRRVVASVRTGTGKIISSQNDVGAWPALKSGSAPADTDHDGMPDAWEQAHGLDPTDPDDRNTTAPSGYTWVEEYINSLIPNVGPPR